MTTQQQPLHSGFDKNSTASEVLGQRSLTGINAIVTGGYSGIGLETVRVLAEAGAQVRVPTRDVEKAKEALKGILNVETDFLDLMDPASIDAFAERFLATGRPLHILINSAGVMAPPLHRDARGNEWQFSTNHLGHYQLTARLLPALKNANGARVVCVSSRGHRFAGVDFADPNFNQRPYDKWLAYGQSKTANVLFALQLDKLGEAHNIRAFSLHPGAIFTALTRHMEKSDYQRVGALNENGEVKTTEEAGFKTVEQGAATSVWCATHPSLAGKGGVYCDDADIAPLAAEDGAEIGVSSWAIDPEAAKRLWQLSEKLTGVRYVW
ncbi:SDR family NAD(P)-dependent oxidoreductase [Pseudomonas reactans]|nr:SDR family NAD(P)-dependent oxidoreductase [Pseudomonas reactans]